MRQDSRAPHNRARIAGPWGGISQGIPPYLILVLPQVAAGADRRLVLPQVAAGADRRLVLPQAAAGMQPQDVNCNNGKKPLTRCLLPLRGWVAGNGAVPDKDSGDATDTEFSLLR